jgi:hypothetical protein
MFAHACELGLEGVVSKVRDSVYARTQLGQEDLATLTDTPFDDPGWAFEDKYE